MSNTNELHDNRYTKNSLNIEFEISMPDALSCYANLFFTHVIFNYYLINYNFLTWKHIFTFKVWEKLVFIFNVLNPMNSYQCSVFTKMKFVFQERQKDPKHLQLWKIYGRYLHDCNMFRQQYKIVVLKCCCSFVWNSSKHFHIYCHFPWPIFVLNLFASVLAHASNCMYFAVSWTFAFAS